MRRAALALVALLASPALASAQPETRGRYTVADFDAGRLSLAGARIPVRVYHPADRPSGAPLVAVIHGFLRNGSFMAEMARTLASRGYVALVPDMPCGLAGCDHDANADQILALLDWGAMQGSLQSSPLNGRIDPLRRGAIGHSWGGLATLLTSARVSELDVAVLLDPQEDRGAGLRAAPSVTVPTAHLMAEVLGNCNGLWGPVFPATPEPNLQLRVVGSGHCDPEEPSDRACPLGCGSGDPSLSYLFRRYAIAWIACELEGDPAMTSWLGGADFRNDVGMGRIDSVTTSGLGQLACASAGPPPLPPDASVTDAADDPPVADAAIADASAPDAAEDAATEPPEPDAGAAAPDAALAHPDAGSKPGLAVADEESCGCTTHRSSHGGPSVFALLAALLILRRRR